MQYCKECGTLLVPKELEHEGEVPYCTHCQAFRFPQYNVAMSAIIFDEDEEEILLIQQYGNERNILVAGYVSMGESLENAVAREIMEETGLEIGAMSFNASQYYDKNQVLMVNFACRVKDKEQLKTNHEIDKANWFSREAAKTAIYPNSLAEQFLIHWLDGGMKIGKNDD